MLYETVALPGGLLEVRFEKDHYLLRFGELVEYADGVRKLRGRRQPYAFRSVEQLRYDFERDVESMGGRLG